MGDTECFTCTMNYSYHRDIPVMWTKFIKLTQVNKYMYTYYMYVHFICNLSWLFSKDEGKSYYIKVVLGFFFLITSI